MSQEKEKPSARELAEKIAKELWDAHGGWSQTTGDCFMLGEEQLAEILEAKLEALYPPELLEKEQ